MKKNFILGEIIGKKVVAIKNFRLYDTDIAREDPVYPGYILFDDGETYLELDSQEYHDYHDYHDYNELARTIELHKDAKEWKRIMEDPAHYPDADTDIE